MAPELSAAKAACLELPLRHGSSSGSRTLSRKGFQGSPTARLKSCPFAEVQDLPRRFLKQPVTVPKPAALPREATFDPTCFHSMPARSVCSNFSASDISARMAQASTGSPNSRPDGRFISSFSVVRKATAPFSPAALLRPLNVFRGNRRGGPGRQFQRRD